MTDYSELKSELLINFEFTVHRAAAVAITALEARVRELEAALGEISDMQPGMDGLWHFAVNKARAAINGDSK